MTGSTVPGVACRAATPADAEALWRALGHAAAWRPGSEVPAAATLAVDPVLARYVTRWPRPGDVGVVAVVEGSAPGDAGGAGRGEERAVGAAWCRCLPPEGPGYGFVSADVPELSVGVEPAWRGRGVGTALVTAVLAAAWAAGHPAISLSVEAANPALRLYRRLGFVAVGGTAEAPTLLCRSPHPGDAPG